MFIHIFHILSFLWKHNTFLAVYCTLLNTSYVFRYIFKKNNKKKREKKRKKKRTKKRRKEQGSNPAPSARCELYLTTTRLRLTTSTWRKVFCLVPFPRKIHRQTPLKMIEPRKTALLTVKKNNSNKNRTHFMAMNELKNIHSMLYKADTPCLRSTMQNICFLISISAVTLKLMVKITSIFGSYRFLRIA